MRRFTRFPTDALYDRRLTKTDLLIVLAICMHLHSKTDTCWPSQATIGKFAQLSRQWVNRRIKHLVRIGWLRKQRRRRKSGMLGSCKYTVLVPNIPPQSRRGSTQTSPKKLVASMATADVAQSALPLFSGPCFKLEPGGLCAAYLSTRVDRKAADKPLARWL